MREDRQHKPTVYFLYGDEPFAMRQFLQELRRKLGEDSSAELNLIRFNPDNFDLSKLQEVCASLPFLGSRRLVIIEGMTHILRSGGVAEQLINVMENLPQTTALVLTIDIDIPDHFPAQKKKVPKSIRTLYEWVKRNPRTAFQRRFGRPRGEAFIRWLEGHCQTSGGEIETSAAHLLAEYVAEDTLIAQQELAKLLDYVNRARPIEVRDIEKLTPFHGQASIFAVVDGIGQRNPGRALSQLHALLETEPPRRIFAMIQRQFRMLLRAREALDHGIDPNQVLKTHPYVARKVIDQARNFSLPQLEELYHKLLEIDVASKTGKDDLEVALDRLVASLFV